MGSKITMTADQIDQAMKQWLSEDNHHGILIIAEEDGTGQMTTRGEVGGGMLESAEALAHCMRQSGELCQLISAAILEFSRLDDVEGPVIPDNLKNQILN